MIKAYRENKNNMPIKPNSSPMTANIKSEWLSGIKSNWQYRQYLQENGNQIISLDQQAACNHCCGCPYYHSRETANNPYLYTACTETTQPYGYDKSDLKNM